MSTLLFARDLIWPFCGWRLGRMHDLRFGRVLTITAEAICRGCGRRWMVNELLPGMVPWDDDVETFFTKHDPARPATTSTAPEDE